MHRPSEPYVLRTEAGDLVCSRCLRAESPLRRLRGLLGRTGLDPDEGMLIRPSNGIHTLFMRFSIDAVFLDKDLVVLRVVENLPPWRMVLHRGAKAVLELPAGAASRAAISPKVRLELAD